jgi:hypothetical protein
MMGTRQITAVAAAAFLGLFSSLGLSSSAAAYEFLSGSEQGGTSSVQGGTSDMSSRSRLGVGVNSGYPSSKTSSLPYENELPGTTAVPISRYQGDSRTTFADPPDFDTYDTWDWQVLPQGLLYRSYWAGGLEPRLGSDLMYYNKHGWYWNGQAGARVGLLRYGTDDPLTPQGWELDIEGAAFPRLDLQANEDMVATDFRCGVLLTHKRGAVEWKFGFYHISSHLGDEYMISHPDDYDRINYVRESLVAGLSVHPVRWLRLYGEVGWTFQEDGGAEPWEFQFGFEAASPDVTDIHGTPFVALNGHLRQENNFKGNLRAQIGWLWRNRNGQTFRIGAQYFSGLDDSYQFYNQYQQAVGFGLWYDF